MFFRFCISPGVDSGIPFIFGSGRHEGIPETELWIWKKTVAIFNGAMDLEKDSGDFYRMDLECSSASLFSQQVNLFPVCSPLSPQPSDEMGYDAVSPYEYVDVRVLRGY